MDATPRQLRPRGKRPRLDELEDVVENGLETPEVMECNSSPADSPKQSPIKSDSATLGSPKHEHQQQPVPVPDSSPIAKKMKTIMEMLECPACLDYPRSKPIFSCSNGHIVCSECRKNIKTESCPLCKDPNLKINKYAERFAEKVLVDVSVNCKFNCHGCPRKDRVDAIAMHEERCQYREVYCPAKHRGACLWLGSLTKMIRHVRENACIQVGFECNI